MSDYYGSTNLDYAYYIRLLKSAFVASFKRVLIASSIVALIAYMYSLTFEPQYEVRTVMHIAPNGGEVFDLREVLLKRRDPTFRETQVGIIKSRFLLSKVAEELELEKKPEFISDKVTLVELIKQKLNLSNNKNDIDLNQAIVDRLLEDMDVASRKNSNLIGISYSMANPVLAAQITNALAEQYIKSVEENLRKSTESSEAWLLERLDVVNSDLKAAELALQEFKEKENIIGSSKQNDGFATQEVDIITGRLLEARQQRLSSESLYQQIIATERRNGDLQGITAIKNDQIVQNIRTELVQLERRRGELAERYGPQHRRMIELDSQINATNDNLDAQVQRVVSALKSEYELAKDSESFLKSSLGQSTNKVQSLGRKQYSLLSLEQDVRTQRDVYSAFLKRLNESRATGVSVNENVWITDPAIPPSKPVSSKSKIFVLILTFMTAAFGFGIAVLRELFDNTITNDLDVQNKLSETSLGSIPVIEEHHDDDQNIAYQYFSRKNTSQFSESIRTIRSSLMLSSIDEKKRRILFTSTVPGEGKTSLSISTAMAFGQVQKTLLIDCDLRRPSLDELIKKGFDRRPLGLSDLCSGSVNASDCIHKIEGANVDLLPAGTINPNPQELFCSTRFSSVLNQLHQKYDVIILDSPPCAGLSDALLLSTHVDQVAYVVKASETPVAKIRAAINSLKNSQSPLAGVIVNLVPLNDISYNYYYGNGYYSDTVQKQQTAS